MTSNFYDALLRRRPEIEARYRSLTPKSAALAIEASRVFPGGVTRDSIQRWPYAPFIESGEGSILVDADGRRITDFWFNATSLPLGYCDPLVMEAISLQSAKGTAFFASNSPSVELAQEVLERLDGANMIRFANSGSEAVMLALRLARGATGRDMIAKFEGSYHGIYDDVSWSVGPSADRFGDPVSPTAVPESAGLPTALGRVLVLPFNDLAGSAAIIEKHAQSVAALIVEPVANRMGFVLPKREFVEGLRDLCDKHGIVLVLDEVISFRVGFGGFQRELRVVPDLTVLGKVIGGGFPVGAVAGKSAVMMASDPSRTHRVTHAGTFNGNPMAMSAGLATMQQLSPTVVAKLNLLGEQLRSKLQRICEGLPLLVTGVGPLFKISAIGQKIENYRDSIRAHRPWEEVMSAALLNEGIFLTPRLQGCVATTTTAGEIDALGHHFEQVLRTT